eukprot:10134949-Alexandrium_andersonii.AAC.1
MDRVSGPAGAGVGGSDADSEGSEQPTPDEVLAAPMFEHSYIAQAGCCSRGGGLSGRRTDVQCCVV